MAVIAVDFDNTMVVGDKPLPGVREAVNILRELKHKVLIHSCNGDEWVKKVLDGNDIRYDSIHSNNDGKPIADLYVDDKGYHFPHNGDWNEELPYILQRLEGKDNRKWSLKPEPQSLARFACGLQLEDEEEDV